MRRITCEERNEILFNPETGMLDDRATVESGLTDLSGEFGEPRIETLWSLDGRLIRDIRHPSPDDGPDRKPCEHYDETEEHCG